MKNFMHWLGNRFNSVRNHNCDNGTVGSFAAKRKNQTRQFSIVDSFFHSRKEGERTRYPKCIFILMAIGLLSVGIGVLSHFLHPYIRIFKWKLIFEAGGEVFELWKTPPVDLYINIFLFNVTNASEYLKGKADKMVFQEVGPYVYRELFSHQNVTFLANGTLFTKPSHPLIFQEHLSKGHKESDIFFLPNIALLGIAQIMSKNNYLFRLPLNLLIRQTKLLPLELQTAKQFMFGYETTITTLGNTFLPNWISFNKVGLIDRMYDFDEDFETIYTGSYDASMSGLYESYLGTSKLKQWKGDHCSNIQNASDGTKFKSFIKEDEQLLFFRKSMCRAQRMVQDGNDFEVSGLQATKFVFEENALDNGEVDTRNKCFCRKGQCLPRGLIDVTECYYGFPIALSYPHFLDADPQLLGKLEGLAPNASLHSSFFMINATMKQLPTSLRNRFLFYLYYLRVFDRIVYYLLFVGGGLLLLFAVLRVSYSLSASFSTLHRISSSTSSYKEVINHHQAHHKRRNSAKQEEGSDQERQHFLL
ncbi:scavenger receptor class B member 1 isoform X2 [Topomyia yanbarensis]|uniref:scavenger receptor class B member 1 isoform X2 n=1 Tax=Topomyia yanbarensis TaxID=2498891 RepID=UPI00273AC86D|nr:scavenger receptor class B member 1 isoform X2 [Topomyia yanbarensis]